MADRSERNRTPIQVEAYSGYKAGETPRSILLLGRRYPVNMIVYRKRVIDLDSYQEEEHFKIDLKEFGPVNVIYNPRADKWVLDTSAIPEKTFAQIFDGA